MRSESIELVLPEPAVLVEPVSGTSHGGWQQAHPTNTTFTPALHKASALEHNEVLANRGERHREGTCQLADGRLSGREPRDNRAPRGVGKRAEDGIEAGLGVNHMV